MKPRVFAIHSLWVSLLFLFAFFLCLSQPLSAHADEVIFSDDFSQGLEKWQAVRNGTLWKIIDGQAEASIKSPSTITEMIPKSAYWPELTRNIEYQLDYTPLEGLDKNISFGFQNLQNWYEVHFVENFYNLVRLENNVANFSLLNPYIMTNGLTYHLRIRFEDGRIQIFVNGEVIADEYDWSFNQNFGKIGIKAGTGAAYPTRVRYDNVVVTALPSTQNHLHFKQSDPSWAESEYDHATSWSDQPTIKRWGCALSSMAMILRAHNINQLPTGETITPLSLNTWLNNQPDGYLGEGQLNWLAVTRLTRIISDQLATPKLELKRVAGASLDAARQALTENNPVILQIPGHFTVGVSLANNGNDIDILDPAYRYTRLSSHHQSLLSTLTFTPSFTDLSYLAFLSQPGLQLSLSSGQQNQLPLESYTDQIADPVDQSGTHTPSYNWSLYPKPQAGSYELKVSNTAQIPQKIQLLAYDQNGNPTQFEQTIAVGTSPVTFSIQFNKTQASQITLQVATPQTKQGCADRFRAELKRAWLSGAIRQRTLFMSLDNLAYHWGKAQPKYRKLYQHTLKTLLRYNFGQITRRDRDLLEKMVHAAD